MNNRLFLIVAAIFSFGLCAYGMGMEGDHARDENRPLLPHRRGAEEAFGDFVAIEDIDGVADDFAPGRLRALGRLRAFFREVIGREVTREEIEAFIDLLIQEIRRGGTIPSTLRIQRPSARGS